MSNGDFNKYVASSAIVPNKIHRLFVKKNKNIVFIQIDDQLPFNCI